MGNDVMLGSVYILAAVMLVLASLMSRREPLGRLITYGLAWIAIFGAGFILFTFRDNLDWVWQRVRAEATGAPVHQGKELRVPMALDGHFWVTGEVNGAKVKFLVDSGATTTTIDQGSAEKAGLSADGARNQIVRTGNGFVKVAVVRARTVEVGSIQRHNVTIDIAGDSDGLNVLGMNFLSTLSRWGVEGRWLVLVP
jgi:aspartyl protease family protein